MTDEDRLLKKLDEMPGTNLDLNDAVRKKLADRRRNEVSPACSKFHVTAEEWGRLLAENRELRERGSPHPRKSRSTEDRMASRTTKAQPLPRARLIALLDHAELDQCPNTPSCLKIDDDGVMLHTRDWCALCCLVADVRRILGVPQGGPSTPMKSAGTTRKETGK